MPKEMILRLLCAALVFASAADLTASSVGSESAPRSPYFVIPGADPAVDRFPLRSTSAEVDIVGVIADVRLTQVYENSGKRPVECVYVFPTPTRGALHGMKMTIGKRTVAAQIRERQQAREVYESACREGRNASLLEQARPNVVQMRIANILPGDVVKVELEYTELLTPKERVYEFVLPTLVGPRYVHSASAAYENWTSAPRLPEGAPPPWSFDLQVDLSTGLPLRGLSCLTHRVHVRRLGPSQAVVTLDNQGATGGNRDFVLRYALAGDRILSGLVLSQGATENFFLAMVQPPARAATRPSSPTDFVFIMDISGSMQGLPLSMSKQSMKELILGLSPEDRFNLVTFSASPYALADHPIPASRDNVRAVLQLIDSLRAEGGTEILRGLDFALSRLSRPEAAIRRVFVLATDGLVDAEREVFQMVRSRLRDDAIFSLGIGSSVNRHLIEGLARVGRGESWVVTATPEIGPVAEEFRRAVATPALSRVAVSFDRFEAYEVEPSNPPDLSADKPIVVVGKWKGGAAGAIRLRGVTPHGPWEQVIPVAGLRPLADDSALARLWAREQVETLSVDLSERAVRRITQLGLGYGLLTPYTSFVAADTIVRSDGRPLTIEQPLSLPEGVSTATVAVAAAAPKAPAMRVAATPPSAAKAAPVARAAQAAVARFSAPKEIPPAPNSIPAQSAAAGRAGGRVVDGASGGVPRGVVGSLPAGVAGSVPGGVVGGVPGGVVGGVVGGVGKTLPPPPQPPAKGQPISVGASLAARRLITRVEPEYPRLAKAARLRGEVLLSVEIDTQGRVANVSVVRGHPLLTQAAVDAVRQWRYIPFVVNGVPAPVVTTVSVRFPPPRAAAEAARDRPGAVRLSDGRPRTSERG